MTMLRIMVACERERWNQQTISKKAVSHAGNVKEESSHIMLEGWKPDKHDYLN